MKKSKKIAILGLVNSGKSTFLAALWHILKNNKTKASLAISALPENSTYLTEISRSWLQFKELSRTPTKRWYENPLTLKDRANEKEYDILIPDLAGETFFHQWFHRQWQGKYKSLVEESSNYILFIHPSVEKPELLSVVRRAYSKRFNEELPAEESPEEPTIKVWNPEKSPTQVILVELLQFIMQFKKSKIRIAIVISAWDLVNNDPLCKFKLPTNWLNGNLPLLYQYLTANPEYFCFKTFGISAQGGDLQTQKAQLLEHENASERIIVASDTDTSNDITEPIKWLMEEI
ncbi:TRAFAC clade GTPase domain-containing protein [Deinococcus misasensis]|uniref:TRAFAC clade GTPase domain-containing protein n=1 Tax=Deinococcus misasensis TaxID=392413 RepID=UPI0005581FCD|nr:hypothetical protein [Deinococcus misasensis]